MNTARKNVVNASTFTKPPKYRPVTGANRGAASAATRPATVIARRSVHDAREHPQQVDRGEDDADRRERSPEEAAERHATKLERAEEHEELADEAAQPRQAERREDEHAEERRVQRPVVGEPA